MQQLILHLPHASTHIPDFTGYVVNTETLDAELLRLTDWYTDELFGNNHDHLVRAPFSRVFCDVERFSDDRHEPMAARGMGVLYQALDNGDQLREVSPAFRQQVLDRYYFPHHARLTRAVQTELAQHSRCLIVDAHSFPDVPLQRDPDQSLPRPDFNIGTDWFHTPPELAGCAAAFFRERGYSVEIDRPYSGSMVPLAFYRTAPQVHSLMLEVNRKLYLEPGTNKKSCYFKQVQITVLQFLDAMRQIRRI